MAYIKSLISRCQREGCADWASHEVISAAHIPVGKFCKLHATEELDILMEQERSKEWIGPILL